MAKKESTFTNMVITLLVISLVASFALGSIYNVTNRLKRQSRKNLRMPSARLFLHSTACKVLKSHPAAATR
jgi:hypothetical protein